MTQTRIFRCDGCSKLTWHEATEDVNGRPVWRCRNCLVIGATRQVSLAVKPDGSPAHFCEVEACGRAARSTSEGRFCPRHGPTEEIA